MVNFFIVKVKYTKQLENGTFKRVTEPYLVQAMCFTDAEATIYEQVGQIIKGEFHVIDISRCNLQDIFFSNSDQDTIWFKIKTTFGEIDIDSEKTKNVTSIFYVQGTTIADAQSNLNGKLTDITVDYQIVATSVTKIKEVYLRVEEDFEFVIDEEYKFLENDFSDRYKKIEENLIDQTKDIKKTL